MVLWYREWKSRVWREVLQLGHAHPTVPMSLWGRPYDRDQRPTAAITPDLCCFQLPELQNQAAIAADPSKEHAENWHHQPLAQGHGCLRWFFSAIVRMKQNKPERPWAMESKFSSVIEQSKGSSRHTHLPMRSSSQEAPTPGPHCGPPSYGREKGLCGRRKYC